MLEGGLTVAKYSNHPLEDTVKEKIAPNAATEDSTHSAKQQLESVCLDNILAIVFAN